MVKAAKASEKNAAKAAAKEEAVAAKDDSLLGSVKAVFQECVLAKFAPKISAILAGELKDSDVFIAVSEPDKYTLTGTVAEEKKEKEDAPKDEKKEENAMDVSLPPVPPVVAMFNELVELLAPNNSLGLGPSGTSTRKAYNKMKNQEMDWGPRLRKGYVLVGSPGIDRISANLKINTLQYLNIIIVLLLVRSFVLRTILTCPMVWTFFLQMFLTVCPVENFSIKRIPIPASLVPANLRVVAAIVNHGLFILSFVWEALMTSGFEKFCAAFLVLSHCYFYRPDNASIMVDTKELKVS